jgi:hypothetical protein
MSQYPDEELARLGKPQLERLHETATRAGSMTLAARIERELTRRRARSGRGGRPEGAYFRRRGDWFVERWDGLRIPVLHSLLLASDHSYADDTPRRDVRKARRKDGDLLDMLEVADLVVVQKDRADGSDAHWHADGYVGLFRILGRRFGSDGSFSLDLALENADVRPKMRTSRGG